MPTARNEALIKPDLLVWAREDAGLSLEAAAKKISVKPDKLLACERGEARLTVNQLRTLSNAYKRPLAFFFLPQPPPRTKALHDFRRLPDEEPESASPKLRVEIRRAKYRRQVSLNLFQELGEEPPRFSAKADLGTDPEYVAREIREILNISQEQQSEFDNDYQALHAWRNAIESHGVMVFQATGVKRNEMRGFSISENPLPVIVVNNKDAPKARIFSMMHELSHVMLRAGGLCNLEERQEIEIYCNRVAGAVLVPQEWLLSEPIVKENGPRIEWHDFVIAALARRYCVGREVILRRLLIADYATPEFYQKKRLEYLKDFENKKTEGGGPPPDVRAVSYAGRMFVQLVLESFYQDKITASDVSDYLEIGLKHLKNVERLVQNPTLVSGVQD
jgi:Zn-dependent peptidase ImmA (M78 family)